MPDLANAPDGSVMLRLRDAINAHDLEALLDCFQEEYRSTFPAHPERAFQGRDQVRKNWSRVFAGLPDFQAEVLRHTDDDATEWAEWRWWGSQADGKAVEMRGVIIAGVERGRIAWGRLFMEEVEQAGEGIDRLVERMTEE